MRTKRTVGAVLALLLLTIGLAACGSDDDTTASSDSPGTSAAASDDAGGYGGGGGDAAEQGEEDEVYAKDFAFSPKTLTVEKGATVTFENQDGTAHTFTGDDGSFDAGTVEPGKKATHTFDEAGSFSFHCEIHPSMKGTIEVE
jgi:plastocyanin